MAIVEMTKAQVIEALEKERLTSGDWGNEGGQDGDDPVGRGCSFCAVGAVVRRMVAKSSSFQAIYDRAEHLGWGPLRQLSDVYEGAVNGSGRQDREDAIEEGRAAAIAHVRDHFPDTVQLNIGAVKPGRGMKVIG